MPTSMPSPSMRIPIELLTQSSFQQFGTVIENPAHSPLPRSQRGPPPTAVSANQGTALKILDVTHMSNLYHLAPSKKPAKAVMNMFVCAPRDLRPHEPSESMPSSWGDIDLDDEDYENGNLDRELFDVHILERHPFTTQTFIPMGLSQADRHTQYIVIVAPTLPAAASRRHTGRPPPYPTPKVKKQSSIKDIFARARPSPFTNEAAPPPSQIERLHPSARPKGPGLPDLKNLRAFVATGNQAVTYGAGTWHAPMAVIGDRPIDFVVVQFANNVGIEDCQEIVLKPAENAEEGMVVMVDSDSAGKVQVRAGVGSVKAKL
ncbi:ureidoglycolate hydrolase-like protein [Corynespora cassiicola Philippines]|uniref:Ureidoglycolate hydrolase-like protein n=1 Tax=Corynespora cassiicola Philippines TaxID=1448308 RepID=A0A2T2NBM2_CORCC|nr:ureidoglycolate hydrolase-like protein [Corynespora cassiicola Philippines]